MMRYAPRAPTAYRQQQTSYLTDILAILQIIFIYVIPALVFVVLVYGMTFGFWGALVMMVGNTVLRKAHISGYTTNAHAAAIGATGTCPSILMGSLASYILPSGDGQQQRALWSLKSLYTVLVYTLAGIFGCAILRHYHVDIGGIDILHSAGAGTLGGVILSIGLAFAEPVVATVFLIILSPFFLATIIGLQWVYVRSNSIWEQRGGGYYGYGEGADAQMAHLEQEIRRKIGIRD